jgi:hypothetical protein
LKFVASSLPRVDGVGGVDGLMEWGREPNNYTTATAPLQQERKQQREAAVCDVVFLFIFLKFSYFFDALPGFKLTVECRLSVLCHCRAERH